jgi:tetratricopeptide (TPR) repeat protein
MTAGRAGAFRVAPSCETEGVRRLICKGRYLYWNKRTEENLNKAIALFQSAIKEDESYAPAYVGLADCYNALGAVQGGVDAAARGATTR